MGTGAGTPGGLLEVFRDFTVRLDARNRPEPDLLIVRAGADTGPLDTCLAPDDVILAAEVVSEDSEERDRDIKPRKYAAAGITHFWRVEQEGGFPVVHVYELDSVTMSYIPNGVHGNRPRVAVPFDIDIDIDIDLTAINRQSPVAPPPEQTTSAE
ncbi:Uma2 family endonuclease [Streptomyces sp. JNUCC 63]